MADLKNFDMSELNDLDFEKLANGPLVLKLIVCALLIVTVVGAGWWFLWKPKNEDLQRVQAEEQSLRQSFESKARRAASLQDYENQLEEMNRSFGAMLRQLPSKAEIAQLLVDISQTGLAAGLQFELFQPQKEVRKDFYAELPVMIKVTGNYHELAHFVSGVANLPRIVTLHNVSISPAGGKLSMEVTAKTYWYLEEGEAKPKPKPAGGRR